MAKPAVIIDKSRPFLKELAHNEETKSDDYVEPFLISQMAVKLPYPKKRVVEKLRDHLRLGIIGVVSPEALTSQELALPPASISEKQLEGIRECTTKKCLMKLNIEREIKALELAKEKIPAFHNLLLARVKRYLKNRELWGYEDRANNEPLVTQMIGLYTSLSAYPRSLAFLSERLWKPDPASSGPQETWLKQDVVIIAPDRMQPILRIAEDFHFEEREVALFFELPIYTNHYFDSSSTLYEVIPFTDDPNQTVLAITDIMEIDELKKSAFIRALFKGTMVKAVSKYQVELVESLKAALELSADRQK